MEVTCPPSFLKNPVLREAADSSRDQGQTALALGGSNPLRILGFTVTNERGDQSPLGRRGKAGLCVSEQGIGFIPIFAK